MRILHLSTLYPPHIVGGAERSVEILAEEQVRLGHYVAASCIERDSRPREERNGVSVFRMAHDNDFWLEDVGGKSRLARTIAKAKQPFNAKIKTSFGRVIDEFKPDIVHTHSLVEISTLVWEAAAERSLPVVHTLRDYDLVCTNSGMFKNGQPCAQWDIKCRAMTFDKFIRQKSVAAVAGVGSEILRRHLEYGYFRHIPERLRKVIWNSAMVKGAEGNYQRPLRTGPFTFGYLGRITIDKGVSTLLRALKNLPKEGWRVLIAGNAAEGIEEFEVAGKGMPVEFAGFMTPKDFFDQVDVLVVPSIWAEPLPRTILEAYSVGVPVIGSRSGGIPELILENNEDWLFNPDDDRELAEKMTRAMMLSRDKLPNRDHFNHVLSDTMPRRVAEKYLDLYAATIGAGNAL